MTISTITFILGCGAIVFSIYRYFKDPQIATEKQEALFAQQMKLTSDAVDKRFGDVQSQIVALVAQSQNHIHTVDTKVDMLNVSVVGMGKEIAVLQTIINERIPKRP